MSVGRRTMVVMVVGLALATVGAAGAVGLVRAQPDTSSQDQCALPLAERTGGWVCFGEAPTP